MCRMVGLISPKPVKPVKYLVEAECSLLEQAVRGDQGDGWGIGWYLEGSPEVVKSEKPVYEEAEAFKETAEKASSQIIVAHVRKASNPLNLPRDKIIGLENSQPFLHGDVVFAHNGVIRIPNEAAKFLGDYEEIVRGNNDSEVYFALLVKEWENRGKVSDALRAVEEKLERALKSSGKGHRHPYSSLNAVFSDGRKLYAYNKYFELEPKSVCYKDSPYYQMTYLIDGDKLVIASEKLWKSDEWMGMENGDLLTAWIENEKVKYNVEKI